MSQTAGEPLLYTLYAVLVHRGSSCHEGHYFCYAKVKSNFLPNKGKKHVLGKTSFHGSVTGSQDSWQEKVSLRSGLDLF